MSLKMNSTTIVLVTGQLGSQTEYNNKIYIRMEAQSKHDQRGQPMKLSGFLKLSLLLCLANFIVIARLHMLDESTTIAQQFFNKKIKLVQTNEVTYFAPSLTSFKDLLSIFTEVYMEKNYLLPLVFEISTLCVALVSIYLNRIYMSLFICVLGNLLSFLLLWINNQDLFMYRLTYIVQGLLLFPMLITSSFSLVRLFPPQLITFKSYYPCLMFLLPQLGIPFSYWLMHNGIDDESTPIELLYGATLKLITVGAFVFFITMFVVMESKVPINNTLEIRLIKALENAKMSSGGSEMSQMRIQQDFIKDKIKMEMRPEDLMNKEAIKIFKIKQNQPGPSSKITKVSVVRISRQKLGIIIMACGLIVSIGAQLPDLKHQILSNILEASSDPQIEISLKQSQSRCQLLTILLTLLATILTLALIRRKKVQILKTISTSILLGYCTLILLFMMVNGMINPSLWLIQNLIILGRACMLVLLMPCVFYVEESGMDVIEGISILFLVGWACQMILRILLITMEMQAKIFILTSLAVIGCYIIEKTNKEQKQFIQIPTQYGKINDDAQIQIELAPRQEQPEKASLNPPQNQSEPQPQIKTQPSLSIREQIQT